MTVNGSGGADSFEAAFGRRSTVRAEAPGRVNLIGEHTDYNGGLVLPMAILQRTLVELARREDDRVCAVSAEVTEEEGRFEYQLGHEQRTGGWGDYLQGVTYVLRLADHRVTGFDLRLTSTVPLGAGLSSSAALEVATLRALRDEFGLAIDDVMIARLGQKVETEFVGAPIGIMDQMASSLSRPRAALFLDARTLAHEVVPLPDAVGLVVIDSGVKHSHATGGYRERRAECERAAAALGVSLLSDLTATSASDLARIEALPSPLRERARHVVTENERVREAVAALRRADLSALGAILYDGHRSLRDDFAVSVPEIDRLVELARGETAVRGARMTGGGFGGSVVLVGEERGLLEAAERVAERYRSETGCAATVLAVG